MVDIITRAAKGSPLSNSEQDQNIINLAAAVEAQAGGVKVVGFDQDRTTGDLTFEFSDGTSIGPIILPTKSVSVRGEWAVGRPYAPGDVFVHDGSSYLVGVAHISTTFAADLAAERFVLLAGKGDAGDFLDAPSTGTPYGRTDGAWSAVVAEAPADEKRYLRSGAAWVATADLDEAPKDGQSYARRDGGWTLVVSGGTGGIAHANSDGKFYASKDGGWASFVPGIADAPNDAQAYNRKGGQWVAASGGGTGGGAGNLRHRGDWSAQLVVEKYDVVEHSNMTWLARDSYGTTAQPPSFANDGQWLPLGFPGKYTEEPTSSRILHRFSTAHKNTVEGLASILNDIETRLKALE